MKNSDNYKFNLPEGSDFYDVEHFNKNFSDIDALLKALDAHASRHKEGGADPLTPSMIGAMAELVTAGTDCNEDMLKANKKVTIKRFDANTLNSPYKEGLMNYSQGVYITFAFSANYATQIAFAGSLIFGRGYVEGEYLGWYKFYSPSNKPTASELGVVASNGSTAMTGNLVVKKDSVPQVGLDNTGTGRKSIYQSANDGYTYVGNWLSENNLLYLGINKESAEVKNLIRIMRIVNGVSTYFNVLHEGNYKEYVTPANIGAVSRAEWEANLMTSAKVE